MAKARLKDYIVPILVVGMLAAMVIPLPYWLLDVFLSFNLAFAILFLISAIFVSEPQKFTSLPTVLLLTTIFRLSLNISTTRTVLAGGEVPEIVNAFGNFVVGGNIVVGAVVFSIITLVQFLVIAKGAERVAEVAARFTLDAMPGKQMAIDADLRAGAITLADARSYRRELQIESKLFGALDGAMKFVKGDAIAGIVITVVNIIAGAFIGCVQQNLSFNDSIRKYGIFTIGDGLVSQIPALVVAAAAGIAITRVADQELLGAAIVSQLASSPPVLFLSSFVLFVFAFTPGVPALPFLFLSIMLLISGWIITSNKPADLKKADFKPFAANNIKLKLKESALSQNIFDIINDLRQQHYEKWGVIVPEIELEISHNFEVEYGDVVISNSEFDQLNIIKIIPEILEELNPLFINDRHTRMLFEINQHYLEDIVNSVIPEMTSLTNVTRITRCLVEEKVSIKRISVILQSIAEFYTEGMFTKTSGLNSLQIEGLIISEIRKALAAQICSDLSKQEVSIYKISENLDQKLSKFAISSDILSANLVGEILTKVEQLAKNETKKIAFTCSKFSRSILAGILKNDARKELVISSDELICKFKITGELDISNTLVPLRKVA